MAVLLTACATTSPKKFSLNPAGYATVERAPHMKRPDQTKPPVQTGPIETVDRSEALLRQQAYNLHRAEAWALEDRLKQEQPDNFVAMDLVWEPALHYVVLFKANAAQTLANYTTNPVFKPSDNYYTRDELEAYAKTVRKRLSEKHAVISSHVNERYANFDTGLTREEFAELEGLQDLHTDPRVKLSFIKPFEPVEAIDSRLKPHIRYLSRADNLNGIVLTSLTVGRIVLRDGCFFLDKPRGQDPLVRFHKEVGITLDEKGFIIIKNRLSNSDHVARVGEWAGWGDGIREVTKPEILAPLQAACGGHPVVHIGTPHTRYGEPIEYWRK